MLLAVGQTCDSVTFALFFFVAPSFLLVAEQNPITSTLFATGGVILVVAVKQGLTAAAIWLLAYKPPSPKVLVLVSIAGISGIVGATFNLFAVLTAPRF